MVAGVFLLPKLAILAISVLLAVFVQCGHVSSLNTRASEKQNSFFFFLQQFQVSVRSLWEFSFWPMSVGNFLSLKNIPCVQTSTKHLNIQSQCYSITCMKHGSQTPFLKHTAQSPWSNTSSAALVARNWGWDQVRETHSLKKSDNWCICFGNWKAWMRGQRALGRLKFSLPVLTGTQDFW